MWSKTSTVYADGDRDYFVSEPLTNDHSSHANRLGSWVRQRPKTAAIIAIVAVCVVVAVVVGATVGVQRRNAGQIDQSYSSQSSEYTLTFQATSAASSAASLCASSFQSQAALSAAISALQSSIANILNVDSFQVVVRSVQCGSETFQLSTSGTSSGSNGSRRLLRARITLATEGGGSTGADPLALVVLFRLLTTPPVRGVASALQSGQGKVALEAVVGQVLRLPATSISLLQVLPLAPPPPSPTQSPSLPPPAPSAKQPPVSTHTPLATFELLPPLPQVPPSYGLGPNGSHGPVPPTYLPKSPYVPPPVYGTYGDEQQPPQQGPPPPPAYAPPAYR